MFLLPSIVIGATLAFALGGNLRRVLDFPLRLAWIAPLALVLQVVIFSGRLTLSHGETVSLHLLSYALLVGFALANARARALLPVAAGLLLNTVAIAANGGVMPLSHRAASAAGIAVGGNANVSLGATHLRALGDVFALPVRVPLANVFSIGDLLIGFGMIGFITAVSLGPRAERSFSPRRLAVPLGVRSFRSLACARFVSQAGDWLTMTAVVGWMFATTHSTTRVAAVLLVRMVPPVLGGGTAAIIVDRLPKRPLLIAVEVARGIVMVLALAAAATGRTVEMLIVLAASGLLAQLSTAAVPALVPRLLDEDLYEAGNALLGVAENAAAALGAAGGGALVALLGIRPALTVDIASFVVAALVYIGVRVPPGAVEQAARAASRLYGLRYLVTRRRLRVLVAAFGAATLATGLVNATLPRLLEMRTHVGAAGYGYGLAAITLGLAIGETTVGTLRLGSGASRWVGCGLMAMSAFLALLALDRDMATIFLVLAGIGIIDGTTDIVFETIVQREAEEHVLGSVFGFAGAFVRTTMIFSVAVAPTVNHLLPPDGVVLGAAAFLLLVGFVSLVSVMRVPVPRLPAPEGAQLAKY
ncbi:MAG TPA: MFS transporter [Gaiellaceae bacterium]|nr:MFS transporter [Gaiellaceae bacterium]